jgi:hypothetical protein
MPRMKSVGFDAELRVLISRLGVYSARSAMFWIRSAYLGGAEARLRDGQVLQEVVAAARAHDHFVDVAARLGGVVFGLDGQQDLAIVGGAFGRARLVLGRCRKGDRQEQER